MEFLRGPKAARVAVSIHQDNRTLNAPAGYVIDLRSSVQKRHDLAAVTAKIVDASSRQNVGDVAEDAAAERAEILANRSRPTRE